MIKLPLVNRKFYFGHPIQKKVLLFSLCSYFLIYFSASLNQMLLKNQENYYNPVGMSVALVIGVVFSLAVLWFTNKIIGPIFQIQKQLEARLRGENSNLIKIRKSDYFQDLAETINLALDKEKS